MWFKDDPLGRIYLLLNKTLTDNSSIKLAIIKTFLFFIRIWWNLDGYILQLHQVSSKSDDKQKSFINSKFNGWVVR